MNILAMASGFQKLLIWVSLLAATVAIAEERRWTVELLRQGEEVLVELHHNDYPLGPANATLDGRRMEVVTRGGKHPAFMAGPGGFGPTWHRKQPTYRVQVESTDARKQVSTFVTGAGAIRMEVADLRASRRFILVGPERVQPGAEVTLRHEPEGDRVVKGSTWGGFRIYFHRQGESQQQLRTWAAGDSSEAPVSGGSDGTLRFRVPEGAPPGPGHLVVNGAMTMKVSKCVGAVACRAWVIVNHRVPIEVVAPEGR
jgi:hypothetical protein